MSIPSVILTSPLFIFIFLNFTFIPLDGLIQLEHYSTLKNIVSNGYIHHCHKPFHIPNLLYVPINNTLLTKLLTPLFLLIYWIFRFGMSQFFCCNSLVPTTFFDSYPCRILLISSPTIQMSSQILSICPTTNKIVKYIQCSKLTST